MHVAALVRSLPPPRRFVGVTRERARDPHEPKSCQGERESQRAQRMGALPRKSERERRRERHEVGLDFF